MNHNLSSSSFIGVGYKAIICKDMSYFASLSIPLINVDLTGQILFEEANNALSDISSSVVKGAVIVLCLYSVTVGVGRK